MRKKIFVTGISTEVGKTIASAIITEALEADYWKPVQSGDLDNSDTHKVKALVSNCVTKFHPNSYALKVPISPHASAAIDGVVIDVDKIIEPETENHLVIEGAGGLLVPLSDKSTIMDVMKPDYKVIVVSRHYLGSINHTLLTVNLLKQQGFEVFILFNGREHPATEDIISHMTGVQIIGRIDEEKEFTPEVIRKYADKFRSCLQKL
ncbi:dethiobiotin synthase [Robertkochia solimangrovi]|uniref:dethiobiotin synthase n=1 Tax=Robertkochia solimangrovi TaxID=2213046 RepID=UPI0011803600|nr:dethiobiotin synthase [Robertkochia solimangrovi]TRZ45814.1 dethiobiotin synthase [Robertkochia solimangrovi]